MGAAWSLVTGPVQEPITLDEARAHTKLLSGGDDATLRRFVVAAREAAEASLNRGLFTQTWQLVLDDWTDAMTLPRAAPLQSVSSITYYDSAGVQQTLSTALYGVDAVSRPARVTRAPYQIWPILQSDRWTGRVTITYVIGWTTTAAIPERIKQGIRLYCAYLDADRDGLAVQGESARAAAEACWDDKVFWSEGRPWRLGWTWPIHRWDPYLGL